ncbi:hypothetical protein RRG08_035572 [Elysia crispata]|uniref:Uncharacterized protein n=1 Tax=Elysia crispata TaxID=231223 RepID=A0AAE1B6P7_9GAST|nr:hypothetical protein RRG08_035572 [Elysia crispata]
MTRTRPEGSTCRVIKRTSALFASAAERLLFRLAWKREAGLAWAGQQVRGSRPSRQMTTTRWRLETNGVKS